MNTAADVAKQIEMLKASGIPLQEVAWKTALLCFGWPYVFGGRGQYCTPANRRAMNWKSNPNIKAKCKNFDGSGSCVGCKYYPDGKSRFFDCRGFTYWVLLQVYGWKLMGAGATSQWNTASNWKSKGRIADGIPQDTLVCLFYPDKKDPSKMGHTGFGFNEETVECSAGVQHFRTRNRKWTHWAVPACIWKPVPRPDPQPDPDPDTKKPTLRKGSSGPFVTLLQTKLIQRGYALEKYGADGEYGAETAEAVKAFQHDHPPLVADGICGQMTWEEIDNDYVPVLYTVTIPHLAKHHADALIENYAGATMVQEGGRT